MLIKVFGKWVNPRNILGLRADGDNTKITLPYVENFGVVDLAVILIKNKTPDEVGNEINKQLKEGE